MHPGKVAAWLVLALTIVLIIPTAFLGGFTLAEFRMFPYEQIKGLVGFDADRDLLGLKTTLSNVRTVMGEPIATALLRLRLSKIEVPDDQKDDPRSDGGSLASFGDELVLLTHDGRLFRVSSDKVERTKISVVDNGFTAYERAASSRSRHLQHDLTGARYNDVLYYREGSVSLVIISYTEWVDSADCYRAVVSSLPLSPAVHSIMNVEARAEDWKTLFKTEPCLPLHEFGLALDGVRAGGRLAYLGSNKIALTIGDYGWEGLRGTPLYTQKDDNHYGKVIEIDVLNRTSRILSKGHRNPEGILVGSNGDIWVTEHGPRGGDELNKIMVGGNYGWPEETYGTAYSELPLPLTSQFGRHEKYIAPRHSWVPSVGVSALMQIKGFHKSWDGDFLVASLKDQSLFRLRFKDDSVIYSERIPIGERVRDIRQHMGGQIVLATDSRKLLFLTPTTGDPYSPFIERVLDRSAHSQSDRVKIEERFEGCRQCHSLGTTDHSGAPALGGVYGRKIASTSYASYSQALLSKRETWTEANLIQFISDPQKFAPGTAMPTPHIDDPTVLQGIAQLVKELGTIDGLQ